MDLDELERSLLLDGNAVAGRLLEIFGVEMTDKPVECPNCGRIQMVGALPAFPNAPGIVMRCSACGAVLLCAVATPRGTCIDVQWILAS